MFLEIPDQGQARQKQAFGQILNQDVVFPDSGYN